MIQHQQISLNTNQQTSKKTRQEFFTRLKKLRKSFSNSDFFNLDFYLMRNFININEIHTTQEIEIFLKNYNISEENIRNFDCNKSMKQIIEHIVYCKNVEINRMDNIPEKKILDKSIPIEICLIYDFLINKSFYLTDILFKFIDKTPQTIQFKKAKKIFFCLSSIFSITLGIHSVKNFWINRIIYTLIKHFEVYQNIVWKNKQQDFQDIFLKEENYEIEIITEMLNIYNKNPNTYDFLNYFNILQIMPNKYIIPTKQSTNEELDLYTKIPPINRCLSSLALFCELYFKELNIDKSINFIKNIGNIIIKISDIKNINAKFVNYYVLKAFSVIFILYNNFAIHFSNMIMKIDMFNYFLKASIYKISYKYQYQEQYFKNFLKKSSENIEKNKILLPEINQTLEKLFLDLNQKFQQLLFILNQKSQEERCKNKNIFKINNIVETIINIVNLSTKNNQNNSEKKSINKVFQLISPYVLDSYADKKIYVDIYGYSDLITLPKIISEIISTHKQKLIYIIANSNKLEDHFNATLNFSTKYMSLLNFDQIIEKEILLQNQETEPKIRKKIKTN